MSLAGRFINSIALPARLHPSDDPEKVGMWGRWSNFITRRPWVSVGIAGVILIPLIIPVSTLRLGQENIGQTSPSTMERQAYDLMADGFGARLQRPADRGRRAGARRQGRPGGDRSGEPAEAAAERARAEQKQGNEMAAELQDRGRRRSSSSRRCLRNSRRHSNAAGRRAAAAGGRAASPAGVARSRRRPSSTPSATGSRARPARWRRRPSARRCGWSRSRPRSGGCSS